MNWSGEGASIVRDLESMDGRIRFFGEECSSAASMADAGISSVLPWRPPRRHAQALSLCVRVRRNSLSLYPSLSLIPPLQAFSSTASPCMPSPRWRHGRRGDGNVVYVLRHLPLLSARRRSRPERRPPPLSCSAGVCWCGLRTMWLRSERTGKR